MTDKTKVVPLHTPSQVRGRKDISKPCPELRGSQVKGIIDDSLNSLSSNGQDMDSMDNGHGRITRVGTLRDMSLHFSYERPGMVDLNLGSIR